MHVHALSHTNMLNCHGGREGEKERERGGREGGKEGGREGGREGGGEGGGGRGEWEDASWAYLTSPGDVM